MKWKLVLSALFRLRNIGVLLVLLGIGYTFKPDLLPYPYITGPFTVFGIYLALVIQSLLNKEFNENFNKKQKVRSIQELNYLSQKLANEAKRNTNSTYLQKLKKVVEDKNAIVDSFLKGERGYLKEKIVEQTMNLVVSYIRLLNNFCIRSRELSGVDVSAVAGRINANTRKLSFTKDIHMADDIKKIIEMDEKMINRLKEEKKDLERISAKLDYMESTVNMFKHQIISSVESEEMLEKLETAVNEAEALDSVLEDRRKSKLRR
jgi:hypothetical protein